ncbi:MAG: hypothetical protein ACP5HM_12485 [Anaerolineae bacterium]
MNRKIKSLTVTLVVVLLLLGSAWTLLGTGNNRPRPILAARLQSTGGPDGFGYVYTDSLTPGGPVYGWVDVLNGAPLTFTDADESQVAVTLPQTLTFYGKAYTQIYVTTNGYLTFDDTAVVTQCVPAAHTPPQTLAALCTDLHLGCGAVYTATTTYGGHQALIVQYDAISHTLSGLTTTFQIILDLVDESITYQYHTLPPASTLTTTVGLIGYATNHDDALVYCRAGADCPPQVGLALRFATEPRPVLKLTTLASNPFPSTGETITYTLLMENTGAQAAMGATMTNTLPAGLEFVAGTLAATYGTPTYTSGYRTIRWVGDLGPDESAIVTYAAIYNPALAVQGVARSGDRPQLDGGGFVYNSAVLDHPAAQQPAGATSAPADTWSDPEPLDTPHSFYGSNMASRRHVAVDNNGTPHIVYGGQALYYATQESGGAWATEVVTHSSSYYPALLLDNATDLPLVAYYSNGALRLTRAISTPSGLEWDFEEIAYLGGSSGITTLELRQDGSGGLHLSYDTYEGFYYLTYDGSWSAPALVIDADTCYKYDGFTMDVDAADVAHIVCDHRQSSPLLRELRLYAAGAAPWSTYEVITSNTSTDYRYPSLDYLAGTPYVSFYRWRDLYYATEDGGWSTTRIHDGTGYQPVSTVIDAHAETLAIAYGQYAYASPGYTDTVRLATRPLAGGAWTQQTVAAYHNPQWSHPYPALALDATGHAHTAYFNGVHSTLEYARDTTTATIDESRGLGSTAIALDSVHHPHVAYISKGIRYAVGGTGWTRSIVVPEVTQGDLALALDAADAPHLFHGSWNTPLHHHTLVGSTWMTRVVDAPSGIGPLPAADATLTATAHLVYRAVDGSDVVARYGYFDGSGWVTSTVAVLAPATANPVDGPKIVASDNDVYILYADCRNYTPSEVYPIDIRLATYNGSSWSYQTLDSFVGTCDWRLGYALLADDAGRLAAVIDIESDALRPSPQRRMLWLQGAGGQVRNLPAAETQALPVGIMSTSSSGGTYAVRGDGIESLSTQCERGAKNVQYTDTGGYGSTVTTVGSTPGGSTYLQGIARSGANASVVEQSYAPYGLYTEYIVPPPPPTHLCCLRTSVAPAEAVRDGAKAVPGYTRGVCGSQSPVSAKEPEIGWVFSHWSGAASGTSKTTLGNVTGVIPTCSEAIAHFIPESEATAVKSANPSTAGVYPEEDIAYRVNLSWVGQEEASISVNDSYAWPRLDFKGSLNWGPYINQCQHNATRHAIACSGLFPESDEPIYTYMSFVGTTTCDLYTTQDTTGGPVRNAAPTTIDGFTFAPSASTVVKVPFRLKASTPNFLPQADFSPGHTILLYTVPKGDEADCCTSCTLDVYLVVDGDTDHPILMKDDASGLNNRTDADFHADDCHHALWFEPTENRAYQLDLYVVKRGDPFQPYYLADTLNLEPTREPELVVYTDLRELFKEFNETQANSATNDNDGNCIRDYYDALARMVRYAEDHDGVLIDVRQDAYAADHDYYAGIATRREMGREIDEHVTANLEEFRLGLFDIAVIGDDAVLPFYRLTVPAGAVDESDYFLGKADGNPTILDTQDTGGAPRGHYMSDLPYATYETTIPTYPKPNISIGRIYYETPADLIAGIEGYEQPIDIRASATSATGLYLANEVNLLWANIFERAIRPTLRNRYGAGLQDNVVYTAPVAFQNERAYLYDGTTTPWNAITTTRRAVQNTDLVIFYAHADHEGWEGEDMRRRNAGDTDPRVANARFIDHTDLAGATMDIAVSTGCHSGYNPVFRQNDVNHPLYRQNLVRMMLDNYVAYYAPTVYGYGDNNVTSHHDLLIREFLKGLFTRYYGTVGDAYYIALRHYGGPVAGRVALDRYVVYSIHLFGLPTQPLQRTAAALNVASIAPQPRALAASGAIEDVIDSTFTVRFDGAGRAVFEVEGGGRVAEPFGPLLPAVQRSYLLPADATNIAVTITLSESHAYEGAVDLQSSQPVCFSFGPLTGIFTTTTGLYPTQLISHTVFADAGGLRLDLTAMPLRYDFDTGAVTLYDRLAYRITYDSATTTSVSGLEVNQGNPVRSGATGVPVTLTLQTTSPLSGTLIWSIEDGAGGSVTNDVAALNVGAGTSEVTWQLNATDWQPGTRQLWVAARDEAGEVVAAASTTFEVMDTDRAVYLPLVLRGQ